MAAAPEYLSLQQFEELYGEEKPHYEYWFGEAIQKPLATKLHGLFQIVIGMLLLRRGWQACSEVRIKLSRFAEPVPDLIANRTPMPGVYPSEAFDLCIEILSPGDRLASTFRKCAHYIDWGIRKVWVIDPERRRVYAMSFENPAPIELNPFDSLTAGDDENGIAIPLSELYAEVDMHLGGN